MLIINVRNVAQALPEGLALLQRYGVSEDSRNGPVIVMPCPVTTVYARPQERVLTSAVRDANTAFHLVESLWMLAGRNDAALLNHFVRDFGDRFSEDGVIHGAYGYRWRVALGFDQLDHVVEVLRRDPNSRQAVIQMWDATDYSPQEVADGHLIQGCDDLQGNWRDRPCNTHIYLRVRGDWGRGSVIDYDHRVLDITVCCRSNDIVWGAYGANAVHFSVLQEYLAARIGVGVGTYYQVSNNYHVYVSELDRLYKRSMHHRPLTSNEAFNPGTIQDLGINSPLVTDERYADGRVCAAPLVSAPETFDAEVAQLFHWYENKGSELCPLKNHFLSQVAAPIMRAHRLHRNGANMAALEVLRAIPGGCDWRVAMTEWVQRRTK